MSRLFNKLTIAVRISAFLCLSALSLSAQAAAKPWASLTPLQQEALAPLVLQWDTLPEKQQKRLLATTRGYPQLSPVKKKVFLDRLTEWSKLTPEQRKRAREKYKAFSKVEADKREEVKRRVLQTEAEKLSAVSASSVSPEPAK